MIRKVGYSFVMASMVVSLGGCATVKNRIPDFDFIKLPEFREDAENIGDYPDVANAAKAPTDVRTDAAWDRAANTLMAKRDGFDVPSDGEPIKTEAEIAREVEALKARVEAYKIDDPQ